VGENPEQIDYIERATIHKMGNVRRAWVLADEKKALPDGVMSVRALWELDCKAKKFRTLELSMFAGSMGGGPVLESFSKPGDWNDIAPRTNGATIHKIVCAR
jgi:hypothetical protein